MQIFLCWTHTWRSAGAPAILSDRMPRRPAVPDELIHAAWRHMAEDGWTQDRAAASVGMQQGPYRKRLVRLGLDGNPRPDKPRARRGEGQRRRPSRAKPTLEQQAEGAAPEPASDPFINAPPPGDAPAGLVADIADFIMATAPRPMQAAALAGALALVAGIAGGSYSFNDSGLNLFVNVIAPPGFGTDAAMLGINRIITAVELSSPQIASVVMSPARGALAPVLKHLHTERRAALVELLEPPIAVARDHEPSTLRLRLADIFTRSRTGDRTLSPDLPPIVAPALTVLTTTAPTQHWPRTRTPANLEDGLGVRFLSLTHTGPAPERNRSPVVTPSAELAAAVATLFVASQDLLARRMTIPVSASSDAEAALAVFEEQCAEAGDLWRHRALQAQRVAALVAVGRDPYSPRVTVEDVAWAAALVRADADAMDRATRP